MCASGKTTTWWAAFWPSMPARPRSLSWRCSWSILPAQEWSSPESQTWSGQMFRDSAKDAGKAVNSGLRYVEYEKRQGTGDWRGLAELLNDGVRMFKEPPIPEVLPQPDVVLPMAAAGRPVQAKSTTRRRKASPGSENGESEGRPEHSAREPWPRGAYSGMEPLPGMAAPQEGPPRLHSQPSPISALMGVADSLSSSQMARESPSMSTAHSSSAGRPTSSSPSTVLPPQSPRHPWGRA